MTEQVSDEFVQVARPLHDWWAWLERFDVPVEETALWVQWRLFVGESDPNPFPRLRLFKAAVSGRNAASS